MNILLVENVTSLPNVMFDVLLNELPWEQRGDEHSTVPRKEFYTNMHGFPYQYGKGEHARTYESQPSHPLIEQIRVALNNIRPGAWDFDVMFANLYEHQHHHLGWHADDSPEMDQSHPIATVSLGAEREIWFRSKNDPTIERLLLPSGSACIMLPGFQQDHLHRIPKHDRPCGPRISLTFRKYLKATE